MRSLKNKIKSRRGASITFALLLFLVCAVISSVVIVAGTAAAGRMSQLTKLDQRYYSVVSAGELFRDVFGRVGTVVVEYDKNDSTTPTPETRLKKITINYRSDLHEDPLSFQTIDSALPQSFDEVLAQASLYLVLGKTIDDRKFTLTPSAEVLNNLPEGVTMACEITETLGKDGLLTFKISNKISSENLDNAERQDDKLKYTLIVVFASNVKKIATDIATDVNLSTENTEKAEVSWKLLNIEKQRVNPAETGTPT